MPRLFPQRDSRYHTPPGRIVSRLGQRRPRKGAEPGLWRPKNRGKGAGSGKRGQRSRIRQKRTKGAGSGQKGFPGPKERAERSRILPAPLDRNRASRACTQASLTEPCGTLRNSVRRNPEGFLSYPGQERTSRQEQCGKRQSRFIEAAALRCLPSSWKSKCWIDPATLGKAQGNWPPRCAPGSARPSKLVT